MSICALLAGCASAPAARRAESRAQAMPLVAPARTLEMQWSPGDFADFVIVTSPDPRLPLTQWPAAGETQQTRFQFLADEPQRFFALYGTNAETGDSAWAR